MHHVLEAKLVVDIVLSIANEFIENESEDVTKQDCELKAFRRLAEKLKTDFPRLPICLLGDSIYGCESIFQLCDDNKWNVYVALKKAEFQQSQKNLKRVRN